MVTFFMALHASLYLNFYVQKGSLMKQVKNLDIILGPVATTTAILIGTTALATVRLWNYRRLLFPHVSLFLSLLPDLNLHISDLRLYILESATV